MAVLVPTTPSLRYRLTTTWAFLFSQPTVVPLSACYKSWHCRLGSPPQKQLLGNRLLPSSQEPTPFPPTNTPGTGSHATFTIEANQPGLTLSEMVYNGIDLLAIFSAQVGGATKFKGWAYPMDLADGGRIAFRVQFGPDVLPSSQECTSWAAVDLLRYGTLPLDLIIFHVGPDGMATAVEIPVLKITLSRTN